MNWVNIQYKNNLRKYEKRDGLKALTTYCLIMCSAFFQGWLYDFDTYFNEIISNTKMQMFLC